MKQARILHLEDDPDYCELVKGLLENEGWEVELVHVDSYLDFCDTLEDSSFDVILADYSLPTFTGLEALQAARRKRPLIPFLIVSGTIGEQAAIDSFRSGATDYVLKQWPERLVPAVSRAVELAHERQRLKQTETHLHLLDTALQATATSIVISDRGGHIVWVNSAFTELTGYSFEESQGQKMNLLKSDEHGSAFYRNLWDTLLAGHVWRGEIVNRRKDGSLYTVESTITPVRNEASEITHFVAVKQDITERKLVQQRLAESEERFRTLFELAPDSIFLCDLEGQFVDGNQTAEETIGYSREELIGKSFVTLNLLAEPDLVRARTALANSAQGEATGPDEYVLRRKDGRRVPVEIRTFPVRIRDQTLVLGIARDASERRQMEMLLRQAQKMEAVGQLAGGVAHDFNNLLAVIRGNVDLLLMGSEKHSPKTQESLKHIAATTERAASLINQLLIFSRKQAMQPEPVLLSELVPNLTKMLKRVIRENIRMECRYAERLPFVQVDPSMIEQVVLNLVINARDAMPTGGQLLIEVGSSTFDSDYVRTHPEAARGDFVSLTVSDTGTGISAEHLDRIFEPFFTTKDPGKGTGLGLSTVYGIIKQHRGWIDVTSRVGEGTQFKIFLPASGPPNKAPLKSTGEPLRGGTEHILLVEDEYSVRLITRRVLEAFDYKVHEATGGREALAVWARHGQEIDLLLTDLILPDGITGRELAEQLQKEKPNLKVIWMSGYGPEALGSEPALSRATARHFLQKPCPAHVLLRRVRQRLDETTESQNPDKVQP